MSTDLEGLSDSSRFDEMICCWGVIEGGNSSRWSEGMKHAWKEAATSPVIAGRTCSEKMMQRGMDRKRQALKRRERDEWRQR